MLLFPCHRKIIFPKAREFCHSQNAIVAEPKNKEENTFLTGLVSHDVDGAWIGIHDYPDEGVYVQKFKKNTVSYSSYSDFLLVGGMTARKNNTPIKTGINLVVNQMAAKTRCLIRIV